MIFCGGHVFFVISAKNSERQTQYNLAEAQRIFDAIPVWHKKIQTNQTLKIGIITDTHVHPSRIDNSRKDDNAPRYLKEQYTRPLRNFVAQMNQFGPEYIIHGGDIIEGTGDPDWLGVMGIKMVDGELKKSGVPVYYVLGNHELRSITKKQFREIFDITDEDRVIDVGDYRFVILDGNYHPNGGPESGPDGNRYIPGFLPQAELEWLKKQLSTKKRTFVFIHQGTFSNPSQGDDGPTKQSIVNVSELREILEEYRVDGIFNGHMEARRYEKNRFTEYYSLTGTKKSKTYPESYYELTITSGNPSMMMYYLPAGATEIKKVDFESCRDAIDCGDLSDYERNRAVDVSEKNDVDEEQEIDEKIEIVKTPAKEGSGLEQVDSQWISIDDSGYIFKGNEKVYESKKDLECITFCNGKYYVAVERDDSILVLDKEFEEVESLQFKVGEGNTGAEGIACSPNGLYVTEQGGSSVYEIDLDGRLLDTILMTHEDLSGADYVDDILYVLSDKDDVIMIVKNKEVVEEIAIGVNKEWEGIKVVDKKIYIIEDDES